MAYGLGDVAGDVTAGIRGYEKEARDIEKNKELSDTRQKRLGMEEERLGMARETHGQTMESRKLALERARGQAREEGMVEATKLLLAGRLRDAEKAWNARGSQRIQEGSLKYDRNTGLVTWKEEDGTQGQAIDKMLESLAGITSKTAAGGKIPADIQRMEYYAKYLTGGDRKKAYRLKQLATSKPDTAYARILSNLQKENADKFEDEKMTQEELSQAAWEAVKFFQNKQLNELFGKEKTQEMPVSTTPGEAPMTGTIDRSGNKDPLGLGL